MIARVDLAPPAIETITDRRDGFAANSDVRAHGIRGSYDGAAANNDVKRLHSEIPAQQRHPVVRDGGYIFLERIANPADRSPPPLSLEFRRRHGLSHSLDDSRLAGSSAQLPIIRSFCGGR
jgi:hypothetical protein